MSIEKMLDVLQEEYNEYYLNSRWIGEKPPDERFAKYYFERFQSHCQFFKKVTGLDIAVNGRKVVAFPQK